MSHSRTALRPLLTTGALAAVLALGLTACGQGGGDATESPSTTPSATESASASPSASASASQSSTAAASPSQSESTSPSTSASPSASTSASEPAAAATEATVYWVAPAGQSGGIEFPGCGEVLIEDTVPVSDAGALGDPALVEAALQALFEERNFDVGGDGLMNALYQSELTVQDVTIEGDNVTVDLAGQPMSGGTCADPQIIAQLENTALANAGTYTAEIFVAGEPIRDFMSQKG